MYLNYSVEYLNISFGIYYKEFLMFIILKQIFQAFPYVSLDLNISETTSMLIQCALLKY